MVELKIFTSDVYPGTLNRTYIDITDLKIDARSCSGVGFTSQEARMAEVELVMDDWLEEAIVHGGTVGLNYTGFSAEIRRDGVVIFCGYIRQDADIIRDGHFDLRLIRLRIYDILWLILDFAEGKVRQLTEGDTIYPASGLAGWLNWLLGQMPADMAHNIEISNDYASLEWAPYFAPGMAIFDWQYDNTLQPEYGNVVRRSIVMYEEGGELYFEYCLHDTFLFYTTVGIYVNATYYQHMVWQKYRVMDRRMGWLEIVSDSGVQMVDHSTNALPDAEEATLSAWIAGLPNLVDSFDVHEENGISELRYDGVGYLIREGGFYMAYHPDEAVWVGDGDDENEDSVYEVDLLNFIEDMTKLLCAWLDADGWTLRIKNRMVLPAVSGYSIPDEEVVSFRRNKGSENSMSMDLSYLVHGDLMREGVERYYNEIFIDRLPYSYELEVVLAEHEYSVGDVVDYDGWIIMITEIDADIYGREARMRGVGGSI
jgi:hypothetical protein